MQIGKGQFFLGDCLDVMRGLPDGSVDMILCDLPYGTTQNKWDSVIPFEPLWEQYWRVCKPNAAVVLTAQAPFDKLLGCSQIEHLKYEWVWEKSKATGHLNAKKQPMKAHENVLVFYRQQCLYNPQKTKGSPYTQKSGKGSENYGKQIRVITENNGDRYPKSVQKFCNEKGNHPTQKPVPLFEYLIKTYTDSGMTVLDNCAGSGTTAIAAERTGRKWVCIEKQPEYYYPAVARVISEVSGQ